MLAGGPRERARGGAGHGTARERGERGAEGADAGKKKERKVKAPTGGPCLSGARHAHRPDARRWAAGNAALAGPSAGL